MVLDLHIRAFRTVLSRPQKTGGPSSTKRRNSQGAGTGAVSRLLQQIITKRPMANRDLPPAPFPTELWIRITEEYLDCYDCSALCQTCWFFNQIAHACLYQTVKLSRSQVMKSHFRDTLALFERSFKARPALGKNVRELFLHELLIVFDQRRKDPYPIHHPVLKLHQLPNLERLEMRDFYINADICHAIHSHPRLRAVNIERSKLDESLTAVQAEPFLGSLVSEVRISDPLYNYPQTLGAWTAIIPTKLRYLNISSPYRTSRVGVILSSIVTLRKNHALETLIIDSLPDSIIQFLISSPRLRHLSINYNYLDDDFVLIFSSLPVDSIPLLQHYSGPGTLSKLLVGNRPVCSVGLGFYWDTEIPEDVYVDALESLQLSSMPVLELEIWTNFMGPWLWHIPATIRRLKFHFLKEKAPAFVVWLPALSFLSNLHTICVNFDEYEPALQVLEPGEIFQISESCPSLREFDLGYQKWSMVKPNVWECFYNVGNL